MGEDGGGEYMFRYNKPRSGGPVRTELRGFY